MTKLVILKAYLYSAAFGGKIVKEYALVLKLRSIEFEEKFRVQYSRLVKGIKIRGDLIKE